MDQTLSITGIYLSFWWLERPRSRCWQLWGLVRTCFCFPDGCPLSVPSHGGRLRRRPTLLDISSVGRELSHHHHFTCQRQCPPSDPTAWESAAAHAFEWICQLSSSGGGDGGMEVGETLSRWVGRGSGLFQGVGGHTHCKHCTLCPSTFMFLKFLLITIMLRFLYMTFLFISFFSSLQCLHVFPPPSQMDSLLVLK